MQFSGRGNKESGVKPWELFKDVAIFATFDPPCTAMPAKTLPNQGLERKIARKLSSYSNLFRGNRMLENATSQVHSIRYFKYNMFNFVNIFLLLYLVFHR